jgi:hypothetical protein
MGIYSSLTIYLDGCNHSRGGIYRIAGIICLVFVSLWVVRAVELSWMLRLSPSWDLFIASTAAAACWARRVLVKTSVFGHDRIL